VELGDSLKRVRFPHHQGRLVKTWSCHAYAFIPIPWRGSSPLSEGGFGGVDRLVRTRASEQKPEELKISAVADADTPPDPGVMESWSCTSCAFIPISLRGFPPLAKGGFGGVDRLARMRASEQRPEESKISAVAGADTPPDWPLPVTAVTPPSQGGEKEAPASSARRNKTQSGPGLMTPRSRPTFHHPP